MGRGFALRGLMVVALAAAAACLVPPFDPTGRACLLPDHPCPSGFQCLRGACTPIGDLLQLTASAPATVLAGTCAAGQVAVLLWDGGLPRAPVSVALESDGGMRLFSDGRCAQEAAAVTVPAGAPDASFSFFALRGGSYAIAAAAGGDRAALGVEISPMARAGRCSLVDGQSNVVCPVAPPVLQASGAFAVFQTSTQEVYPGDGGARCALIAPDALGCDRAESTGQVDILWQVAEVPGASVQRVTTPASCSGAGAYAFALAAPVDPARAFVLFSERRFGVTFGVDDWSTARLTDPSTVTVDNAAGCTTLGSYAVQVVSLPGAQVDRGLTGSMDAGVTELDVTALAPAPPDQTLLLHSHRYAGSPTGPLCAKVVRGEAMDDAGTALRFSRGLGNVFGCSGINLDVAAISWERIQVPPGDRLQRFAIDLPANQLELVVPIAPVDPTRALVLASGQGSAGQGFGETRDTSLDQRAASVALELDPTGTSFRATRTAAGGPSRFTVFVWEFGPSP